jgi:hypothetical protein
LERRRGNNGITADAASANREMPELRTAIAATAGPQMPQRDAEYSLQGEHAVVLVSHAKLWSTAHQ